MKSENFSISQKCKDLVKKAQPLLLQIAVICAVEQSYVPVVSWGCAGNQENVKTEDSQGTLTTDFLSEKLSFETKDTLGKLNDFIQTTQGFATI